jgi:hypothetical protein
MFFVLLLQTVSGKSSRIRFGLAAASTVGFTGLLSTISTRRLLPSRAAETCCTLTVLPVCAVAQENKSIVIDRCFWTAVIRR